ncbi:MAG TPA: YfhO family protein [Thermoanaerobaculia bacterium]|nr:YfhO family protein [Thermoanaerobaculia bacterium]
MNPTFLYVAALYFGSLFVWRRWSGVVSWRVAILFYALVLVFLFRPMTQPYVNVPADFLFNLHPWKATERVTTDWNPEINDVILQMVPWAHQVRESWKDLEAPLWNAAAGGGYPLLANGQSGGFSLFRLASLPLPLGQSLTSEAALKILLALTFTFAFLRRRYSEIPSVAGAVSFGFATFIIVWLHFPHSSVVALLPALFYGIDLLFEQQTRLRFVFLSFVFAFLLLNGHPESAAHSVFAAGLYVLFLMVTRREARWRATAAILVAGVTALLLAAPFILPLLDSLKVSQRMELIEAHANEVSRNDVHFLIPFFNVGFYGSMREKNIWGPGIAEILCGYAGLLGIVGWFAVLAHRIRSRHWKDPIVFFIAATPLFVAISMGARGIADAFHQIPLFSMAANARLRFVVCWLLAVLAAAVVDLLLARKTREIVFGMACALVMLIVPFFANQFPSDPARHHSLITSVPGAIVLIVLAIALSFSDPRRRALMGWVVVAAAVGDLWSFGISWNPVLPDRLLYPSAPIIRHVQNEQARVGADVFRVGGFGGTFFPNASAMYGFEDVRAHDPMAYGRYLGALRVFSGYSSYDYFAMLHDFDNSFLDFLNLRFVFTAPHEAVRSPRFVEIYSDTDGRIYENRDVLPRFFGARNVFVESDPDRRFRRIIANDNWRDNTIISAIHTSLVANAAGDLLRPRQWEAPLATVRMERASARGYAMTVEAPRWSLIASSIPNRPGWKIRRNGGEKLVVTEVNAMFVGFIVPPGSSHIRVLYQPNFYYTGCAIAIVTLAALILLTTSSSRPPHDSTSS